jgi:hypothetical protein
LDVDNTARGFTNNPRTLLVAWLIGPLAWIIHLFGAYLLAPWACATHSEWILHLLTLATLLLGAGGVALNAYQWRKFGRGHSGEVGEPLMRGRFMSMIGLLASLLFLAIIVAQAIPILILGVCE